MSTMNHAHQENLFDPKLARKVYLFGAGSVGSWLALFLAKMGMSDIEVWDADLVSSYNVPMSLYRPQDVGRYKVDALAEIVLDMTGVTLTTRREMYAGQAALRNALVVSCVDTMEEGRKPIWEAVKKNRVTLDLFCDTRTSECYVEVLSIEPCSTADAKRYDAMLFPDTEAAKQLCGRHGIVFTTTRAAGIVAANIATFLTTGSKEWLVQERCDTLQKVT